MVSMVAHGTFVRLALAALAMGTPSFIARAMDARDLQGGKQVVSMVIGFRYSSANLVTVDGRLCVMFTNESVAPPWRRRHLMYTSSDDNGTNWATPKAIEEDVLMPSHDGFLFLDPVTRRLYCMYNW